MQTQESVGMESDMVDDLLAVNRLNYKIPPVVSIMKQRHYVSSFADQSTYTPRQTMIFTLQSGSEYIDFRTSYLRFTLTTTTGSTGDFGLGSSANIFERILVRHRSGTDVSRLEGANLWTNFSQRFESPQEALTTVLAPQGYSLNTSGDGKETKLNAGYNFIIPLWVFPCFKNGKITPSQAAQGMRFELTLADIGEAIFSGDVTAPTSYTVSNIELRLDQYQLSDVFARKLNEIAAREGLHMIHHEVYRYLTGGGAATNYDFNVDKSVSKATQFVVVPRTTASITSIAADSMIAQAFDWKQFQAHVGSVYYPNAPIVVPSQDLAGVNEAYYYSLAGWQGLNVDQPQSVTPATFLASFGAMCIWLGTSQASDMAGIQLNNSRSLVVEAQFATSAQRQLSCYLKHLRLVSYFLSNAVVRD